MATNIVFFGSSAYSVIVLKKLLSLPEFRVVMVVTKIDQPVGRQQLVTPNPVTKYAADHSLPRLQITEFNSDCKSKIADLHPQLGLCVAFGPPFFDQAMIDLFPQKIINNHPSALPKYRGATPGPWQIINGETTSAVTFFQIDLLPDHGPIITQIPLNISPADTAASFYTTAFSLAADNLGSVLKSYLLNPQSVFPQDHTQKSYYPKFTKESAKIDWSWPEIKIDRFIRALHPWPIAWTDVKNTSGDYLKMKIFSADFNKILNLNLVQIEGKKAVLWSEIKKYYQIIKKI